MLKLAIIDDEKLIVQGLEILIDWQSLGIEVVCATTDPNEIIEKCYEFDLLLSDVQMPKMTGIELIHEVKCKNPKIECVILSGYDDFKFAQKSMQVGVGDYLLKPVDENEIMTVFNKLVLKKKEQQEKEGIIRKQLYYQLLENPETVNLDVFFKTNEKYYYLFLAKSCNKFKSDNRVEIDFLFEVPKKIGIARFDHEQSEQVLQMLVQNDAQIISPLGECKREFVSCFQTLHEFVVFDENKTIISDDLLLTKFDFVQTLDEITKFQNALIQEDNQLSKLLMTQNLVMAYSKVDFENLVLMYVLALQQFTINQNLKYQLLIEKTAPQLLAELIKLPTGQAVVEELCTWNEMIYHKYHEKIKGYTPIIRRVMTVIEQDYQQDISLKTLSHKLNMNASYLGQIFKEEVGTSFNFYINKMRMEKAQELLLHSDLKINQIAQCIGFQDNSYFYRKFKNYYGYCPNTLRKSK